MPIKNIKKSFGRLVEKSFFKRRFILYITKDDYQRLERPNLQDYSIILFSGETKIDSLKEKQFNSLVQSIGEQKLRLRLYQSHVTLYLIERTANGDIVGYLWSLHPRLSAIWHDKVKVEPGSALTFNGYIYPQYRRKGFHNALLHGAHNHLFSEMGCQKSSQLLRTLILHH